MRQNATVIELAHFEVSVDRGFLPARDPLSSFPGLQDSPLEVLTRELPKLLAARRLRDYVDGHLVSGPDEQGRWNEDEYRAAARILSFTGQAYVWESPQHPATKLPAHLAKPWHRVLAQLGRPPVLSYASYCLDNWRRLDQTRPIQLGNLALLQNFLGGVDEEWFVLVHVEIEARAGAALGGLARALQASQQNQPDETQLGLEDTAAAMEGMCRTLDRMPEQCDPYIYFNRVRPYIHGWKDHPALPEGLLYEGVEAYGGKPQQFRGETGAQSSIVPALDAALGVVHADDPLRQYLIEMRTYMPSRHRAFIEAWERLRDGQGRSQLCRYVFDRRQSEPRLWDRFRACVQGLCRFRQTHLDYADRYIQRQSQRTSSNPTGVGTGGTPFMTYLKKHLDETAALIAE